MVMRDVGGNFGTRGAIYRGIRCWSPGPRERIGRPVKWTCERSEAFLSDYQGRDLAVEAELALDADGNFLAMRGDNIGNLGALTAQLLDASQKGVEIMSSIYRVPAAHFRARCVLSNTAPTRPYRSSGRPEVMYVMERLIDLARAAMRLRSRRAAAAQSRAEVGRLPYRNPFGMVYDSGDYHGSMDKALELGDWNGFPARRARRRASAANIAASALPTMSIPRPALPRERAEITVHPDGVVDVVIGTVSNGQGHETSFAQLVSEWLGVPLDSVRLITGDTDIVTVGGGTHSGRGMRLGSIVMLGAIERDHREGQAYRRHVLRGGPWPTWSFADGRFSVEGHRPVHRPLRRRRRGGASATICRTICAGR